MPGNLKRLLPRHYMILELYLNGMATKAIADAVKVSTAMVNLTVNSPIFQDSLARRRREREHKADKVAVDHISAAHKAIEEAANDAVTVHTKLMNSGDERVALMSAKNILDKAFEGKSHGGGAKVVIEAGTVNLLNVALEESKISG